MKAKGGVYPRLGRYFKTAEEFADAACMTRPTLNEVLAGKRDFTKQEQNAICGALAFKVIKKEIADITIAELITDSFDELFRTKE